MILWTICSWILLSIGFPALLPKRMRYASSRRRWPGSTPIVHTSFSRQYPIDRYRLKSIMVKTLSRIPRGTTGAIRLNLWSQYRAWRYASAIFIWLPAGLLLVALAVLRSQDNTGRSGLLLFDDKSSPCYDKHYLADFVRSDEDRDRCINMPAWSEISKLYGDEPRIIGLETCQRYREMLAEANRSVAAPVYPMPRVAGLQNTGTRALRLTEWAFR